MIEPIIIPGDCLDMLPLLNECSVDAIVTDPPYGLGFMGKAWDSFASERNDGVRGGSGDKGILPGYGRGGTSADRVKYRDCESRAYGIWCEQWAAECLRVLKPGGHLLAFGGTRTWHRLATAVEDAGFELRDSIAWLYGSGFPKSLDVSKAIDKAVGAEREVIGERKKLQSYGTAADSAVNEVYGGGPDKGGVQLLTAPATPDATRWSGWGTALKPAHEPIVVARKPLISTVAANVLAHGTGALNIDACRIAGIADRPGTTPPSAGARETMSGDLPRIGYEPDAAGRWPANVVLDESQAAVLDEQSGIRPGGAFPGRQNTQPGGANGTMNAGWTGEVGPARAMGDSGGASRFFYVAKAGSKERPKLYFPSCECEDAWPTTSPEKAMSATATAGGSSMSRCGSGTTDDPSPSDTRFTTATTTSETTIPPTSLPSLPLNTSDCTPDANCGMDSGGNPAEPAESSSASTLPIGTSRNKVGRSTDDADPAISRLWSKTSVCAECGAPSRVESHATVKPLALMRWLVRLVTPPGGTVLDPFLGSGTTAEACMIEGFACIGIEREPAYLDLIKLRLSRRSA